MMSGKCPQGSQGLYPKLELGPDAPPPQTSPNKEEGTKIKVEYETNFGGDIASVGDIAQLTLKGFGASGGPETEVNNGTNVAGTDAVAGSDALEVTAAVEELEGLSDADADCDCCGWLVESLLEVCVIM